MLYKASINNTHIEDLMHACYKEDGIYLFGDMYKIIYTLI